MRTFRFGRYGIPYWPGRNVAGTYPVHEQGVEVTALAHPLPVSGGFVAVRPASAAIIDREATAPGRSFIDRTADDLDTGVPPDRINRNTTARNGGTIGHFMGGWPYDGNAALIPHRMIPRNPITVTPFARTIDTGVTVPSLPIGGPL